MKKKLFLIFLFLPLGIFAQENSSNSLEVIHKLKRIEDKYFRYLSFEERREALMLMDEVIELLDSDQVSHNQGVDEINIISNESFTVLLRNVSREISGSDQVRMVLAIGQNGYLNCSQLKQLVKRISFDSYKVQLIKEIYPNVIDPVNLITVTPLIDSSFDREALEYWLSEQ